MCGSQSRIGHLAFDYRGGSSIPDFYRSSRVIIIIIIIPVIIIAELPYSVITFPFVIDINPTAQASRLFRFVGYDQSAALLPSPPTTLLSHYTPPSPPLSFPRGMRMSSKWQ